MERRRELSFDRLDRVMPDVQVLLKGHVTSGAWSLAQILRHLATSIRLSLGSHSTSEAFSVDPALTRTFEVRRRRFFKVGRFPEGADVPHPLLIPPPDLEEKAEAESLRLALREFESFAGRFPPHPYLGTLPRDEWDAFHGIHCAHHLSFVRPID